MTLILSYRAIGVLMAMYAASSVAAKADTISLECEKASEGAGAAFMFVTMNLGNRTARMNENGIWYNYTISKLTDDRVDLDFDDGSGKFAYIDRNTGLLHTYCCASFRCVRAPDKQF